MFQSASRYLPALPAGLPGAKFLRFEVPDTTFYSLVGTTFNLLNGTTGPGLLALPLAFSRCGYLTAASLLLLTFGFNHLALQYLLKSCLVTREHSYIGLSLRAGPHVAAMVDWASLVFFFGSCVSYLVIIGDTFSLVSAHIGAWLGAAGPFYKAGVALHYSYLSLGMLSAFTGFCLLPLSMLRSMDSLQARITSRQVTSGVAMLCIIYAIGVIVCTPPQPASLRDAASLPLSVDPFDPSDESPKEQTPSPQAAVPFRFSSESMLALPTMAFCFASQSLFPPALETLHQPATYHHLQNVVDVTMYTTFALHLLVGLSGYLRYGSYTAPNVLDNLPPSPAVGVARLAIVLAFAFTYPMMIFLCRMHIQSIMARWELASQPTDAPTPVPSVESYHRLVSVLLVGASLACSVLFPNIDMLFGLLGGTTAVVISFVAPSIFWDQFVGYMYKWSHPRKLMSRALLGFAALIASLALPAIVVDILGDLYATAWWVPMSTGSGLRQWSGGIQIVEGGAQSNGQT